MTYKEMYERSVADATVEKLTPTYFEFRAAGDSLIGEYVSKAEVRSTVSDGTYSQYIFRTDNGVVKFHLGAATDREVRDLLVPGRIYYIEYEGKEKLAGSKSVNKYVLWSVGSGTESYVEAPKDVTETAQSKVPF